MNWNWEWFFILMKLKHREQKLKMKLIGRVILHETINNVFTKAFLFISYRDCIIKGTQKRLCSLYSNTPFNLHLSSINFDTHIHSWSLYNIVPVSYSLYPLFSLNKNISLFWRRMNLENCQKYINLPYNIQNILNVSGNNHTKCQIAFYKKWCKNVTLVSI